MLYAALASWHFPSGVIMGALYWLSIPSPSSSFPDGQIFAMNRKVRK